MSVGNTYVEAMGVLSNYAINDLNQTASSTGSVGPQSNSTVYDVTTGGTATATITNSVGALNAVESTAAMGMTALNNAVQGSESASAGLASGVDAALQNRSQNTTQTITHEMVVLALVAGGAWLAYLLLKGK